MYRDVTHEEHVRCERDSAGQRPWGSTGTLGSGPKPVSQWQFLWWARAGAWRRSPGSPRRRGSWGLRGRRCWGLGWRAFPRAFAWAWGERWPWWSLANTTRDGEERKPPFCEARARCRAKISGKMRQWSAAWRLTRLGLGAWAVAARACGRSCRRCCLLPWPSRIREAIYKT